MWKIHLTIVKQSFICNFAIKTQVHSARHLSLFMSKLHMCLKLIVTMKSINTTLEYLHILHIGFHLIIKNSKRPQFQRRIRVGFFASAMFWPISKVNFFCLSHVYEPTPKHCCNTCIGVHANITFNKTCCTNDTL